MKSLNIMTKTQIYQGLLVKGYSEKQSLNLASQLSALSDGLSQCLFEWLSSGKETDFNANGFSLVKLMANYNLKYPAALLSLDWVIKDPEVAIPIILKGIR